MDKPDDGSTGPLTAPERAQEGHKFHSLVGLLGQLIWVAREAHWGLRWTAKEGGTATLQKFLTISASMLAKWTTMLGGGGTNEVA